jgi:hypothetical protein
MANSVPTLAGLDAPTFLENIVNGTPQLIDATVTFSDADNNFTGSALTVSGLLAEDTVAIRNQGAGAGEIGISGSNVTFGGTIIGTFAGGAGATLSVTFNASATAAAIDALLENLTYANSSDAPAASRTLQIKVSDAAGVAAIPAFTFVERAGAANPFGGIDVGLDSTPTFADIDGDGDLDAFVGRHDGHLHYFQNIGSAIAPAFAAAVSNPFGLANVASAFARTPSFADLDGDGDLDAFTGEDGGTLYYFENTGSATAPAYAAALTNPFGLTDIGNFNTPTFVDLDGDGDLDAIIGAEDGDVNYFENTGSASAPAFAAAVANPFGLANMGFFSNPTFADLDSDGDLDAIVGESDGTLNYFQNTGSASAPAFAAAVANPFDLTNVGSYSNPTFADLDSDGDLDAIVGEENGILNYFENTTPKTSAPDFVAQTGAANPFDGINVGIYNAPSFADLDSDGDLDAIVGAYDGNLYYFENIGSAVAPAFAAAVVNPFGLTDVGALSAPAFADLDGDGDLDAIVGKGDGTLVYFQNIGSAVAPAFAAAVVNPFGLTDVGDDAIPTFADLDGDGDLDVVVGERDGILRYFQNTGSSVAPSFAAEVLYPFGMHDVGADASPSFADADADGDLDAIVGAASGILFYFENTGSAAAPAFAIALHYPRGLANVGLYPAPRFADLDGDGDPDVIVGQWQGGIAYFKNTGSAFELTVNVTAQNDAPVASANAGLAVNEGADGTIGQALLAFADAEQTAASLTFTITSGPANGTLAKGGSLLGVGGTFTQADIDANLITYTHNGGETSSDSFGFGVSDGAGGSVTGQTFALTVTPQNDAPAIASNGGGATAGVSIAENGTAVTTVTANDVDGPSLAYTIIGGADAAKFQIDASTGALAFVTAPDFEAPADADGNNSYVVEVRASDGSLADTQTITVSITDADETIYLTPGVDDYAAPAGHVTVNALGGIDTVTFGFKLIEASISYAGNTVIVDGPSGSQTVLIGFEKFAFTDGTADNDDGYPLVDDLFYYARSHDVWNAHVDADFHYNVVGWKEGRDPSAFFDTAIYLSAYPDVAASGVNPLTHYDATGWKEGRIPSLAFDGRAYLAANPDVAAAHVDPLWHFLAVGASEGRQPIETDRLIGANGFDYAYYLNTYTDVKSAGVDPLQHFQAVGWTEGRNPNALFDTAGYLATYTDVAAAHINPLDHYNQFGWHEGRDPSVGFDTTSYLAAYPDVAAANVNPLMHFLHAGQQEGRSPFADGIWG